MNTLLKLLIVMPLVAVIGGVSFWLLSPFISGLGSATTLLSSIPQHITNLTQQVQPVITYVQDNALQLGSITAAVTGFGAVISSKIAKANAQKKEIETTITQNNLQSSLFQAQGEVLGLQNQLTEAQGTIKTLESNASNVATLTNELTAKRAEVDRLIAEKNQLERLLPNIQTVEQMKEELKKVQ